MRIDDLNRTPVTQSTERTDQTAQSPGTTGKDAVAGSDQADVSPLAKALSTTDPARIEQLRLDVQSGKYNVSAEAVARSIIDAHLTE
ncbi:MAG TPA: flagellar biosynthesis anti-sigma factor FlgM [Bryobacteraceae bacterium]|jgi:flagellar biosynthesis anti-sigma factor FlgM|nr:flagellar biosynthesis anti-sigma factor FlgM [Bryobacteraceae bacterium]